MKKLIFGVGINDAGYIVQPRINGKQVVCPYYYRWKVMLQRCYSKNWHTKFPTYIGCEVSEEWKTFSKFKAWMVEQDWKGKQLDKDILIPDNKLYSRDTCVFVTKNVNTFLIDSAAARGVYMIGVSWHKEGKKFCACCSDGDGKNAYLGLFESELEAHLAWKVYKHTVACKLAEEQSDVRIAEALRNRFAS